MRLPGWPDRLKAVVEKHMALPSQYGLSDCYIICDDGVEACLGERIHPPPKPYRTAAGTAPARARFCRR